MGQVGPIAFGGGERYFGGPYCQDGQKLVIKETAEPGPGNIIVSGWDSPPWTNPSWASGIQLAPSNTITFEFDVYGSGYIDVDVTANTNGPTDVVLFRGETKRRKVISGFRLQVWI